MNGSERVISSGGMFPSTAPLKTDQRGRLEWLVQSLCVDYLRFFAVALAFRLRGISAIGIGGLFNSALTTALNSSSGTLGIFPMHDIVRL